MSETKREPHMNSQQIKKPFSLEAHVRREQTQSDQRADTEVQIVFSSSELASVEQHYTLDTFDRYTDRKLIDQTSFNKIYKARRSDTNTQVAIKIPISPEHPSAIAERKLRVLMEMKAAELLAGKPYILQTEGFVKDDEGHIGIVTQWAEGGTLERISETHNWELTTSCAIQIALGLEELSNQQMVWRDLKPGNVFLLDAVQVTALPRCALGDFGLLATESYLQKEKMPGATPPKSVDDETIGTPWEGTRITPEGTANLTYVFASPEQRKDGPMNKTSDYFSLGILLYKLIYGSHLPEAERHKSTIDLPKVEHDKPESQVRDILHTLLQLDPAKRTSIQLYDPTSTRHVDKSLSTPKLIAKALAQCWNGSGSGIEQTPWFKEALEIQ